ncbi:hypothetical protein KUCAC02_017959 [Chaenocephalus aceratus]|uniref:Uncharacterized protein n=1 Tax=Chaenocephalus aceratus TaxID=36190 RepID=A0ACB9W7W6_CHAAC|nr:hypothetical protein KUCAC02_017959 [Chaenocephalus aceratus]
MHRSPRMRSGWVKGFLLAFAMAGGQGIPNRMDNMKTDINRLLNVMNKLEKKELVNQNNAEVKKERSVVRKLYPNSHPFTKLW